MSKKKAFELDGLKPSLGEAQEYVSFFEGLIEDMNKDIQSVVLQKAENFCIYGLGYWGRC